MVVDAAVLYGMAPADPPATFVAFVAVVAVAALPPIDRPAAVPVRFVPGPEKSVVAVTVVPRTVAAVVEPTVVPSIDPPVIATEVEFWVDMLPRPVMSVFGIDDEAVRALVPVPLTYPVSVVAPVPPLATLRVPPRVIVPLTVMGPPLVVRPVVPPETSTEVTVPPAAGVAEMVMPPAVLVIETLVPAVRLANE